MKRKIKMFSFLNVIKTIKRQGLCIKKDEIVKYQIAKFETTSEASADYKSIKKIW